jgi:hypothetical protein
MQSAAEEAKHDYFEFLYVHRDDARRTIQLSAGAHPIPKNPDGSPQMEGGASLVLSQDTSLGHIAAMIYPYETIRNTARPIFWGFFDSPADVVADKWLDEVVHDFARCCRASSVVDQTVHRSDRLWKRWLEFRSKVLLLRGRTRWFTKLIRAKPSLGKRVVRRIAITIAGLTAFLTLPSIVATLMGITIPGLWDRLHSQPPALDSASSSSQALEPTPLNEASGPAVVASQRVTTVTAEAKPSVTMPIISGWYTFCPSAAGESNPKLLDFLYDVRANAGKVAFFDVQVDIDCVLSRPPAYEAPFNRIDKGGDVTYLMRVPLISDGDGAAENWISGARDHSILRSMYTDNGSAIAIHSGNDDRNLLSRFQPHVEGSDDVLFGPYAIKEISDDDAITFDLNAPFLDEVALKQATEISEQIRNSSRLPLPQ